jgi:hypothetical protein
MIWIWPPHLLQVSRATDGRVASLVIDVVYETGSRSVRLRSPAILCNDMDVPLDVLFQTDMGEVNTTIPAKTEYGLGILYVDQWNRGMGRVGRHIISSRSFISMRGIGCCIAALIHIRICLCMKSQKKLYPPRPKKKKTYALTY